MLKSQKKAEMLKELGIHMASDTYYIFSDSDIRSKVTCLLFTVYFQFRNNYESIGQ